MPRRIVLALAGAALLTGCPGSIEDPIRFRRGGDTCPEGFDVEADLLRPTCGRLGCHTGGPTLAAAGLDLSAPGVGPRLLAHHSMECEGRAILDPAHLEGSYLLEKLDDDSPACGERMPLGLGPLSAAERACLDAYLAALVASAPDAAAPPPLDAGVAYPDSGAPSSVTIEAESMELAGYASDAANPAVIRIPDAGTSGTAGASFDGAAGRYSITVRVWAETDGQPTIALRVAGAEVASETYPLATMDFEEVVLGPYEVELAPGDRVELEGTVGGGAWARVDRVEIAP